jgi:3-phosphoshikimate 1-carboxyvinyltransferase
MSRRTFGPRSGPLVGDIRVPGDKSLSHRAVLFSAMAEGTTELKGLLDSADVRSTIGAVTELGAQVEVEEEPDGSLSATVTGWGGRGPRSLGVPIDCGNSGTTCRLIMGVLAGWPVEVTLVGDESLSGRPMRRVTEPLTEMGASIRTSREGTLPIRMMKSAGLGPIDYRSPVASAQVKSAILLAGLRASGRTSVTEPAKSRDHTERLLPAFGVDVVVDEARNRASLEGPASLRSPGEIVVPRDPSSAAFIVCAALLIPGSRVRVPGVSLNETRTGFISVLERMGADMDVVPYPEATSERVGELNVRFTRRLAGTTVSAAELPSLVDEVPVLALVASLAAGETRFEGAGELRVKESDRFAAIVDGLTALGAEAHGDGDTLVVHGGRWLRGATLDSLGDHRLAMTWAIAGLAAIEPVTVERFEAVGVSFPTFAKDLSALCAGGSAPLR